MRVQYVLDEEGGIDPEDPLGDLLLADDAGNSIFLKETFIDVWLVSFIKSILKIHSNESLQVEVLEEPYGVLLKRKEDELIFSYRSATLKTDCIDALSAFKNVSRCFIHELSMYSGVEKNASIHELEGLLAD